MVQALTLLTKILYTILDRKGIPFCMPSIEEWCPFHERA